MTVAARPIPRVPPVIRAVSFLRLRSTFCAGPLSPRGPAPKAPGYPYAMRAKAPLGLHYSEIGERGALGPSIVIHCSSVNSSSPTMPPDRP